MTATALAGELVRLVAFDPERDYQSFARWNQDSQFQQLQSSGPANLWPAKDMQDWFEKHYDEMFMFSIRTKADDRLIGEVDLNGIDWVAGNCWVGIGIGERDDWGKGYGTEAINLILRFAFESLNLRRVSLNLFEYNERAYKSYCKVGFKDEGRMRQWMQRRGERFDLIFMGILRCEWEEKQRQGEKSLPVEQT